MSDPLPQGNEIQLLQIIAAGVQAQSGDADPNAVHYNAADGKSAGEQAQARANIGAAAASAVNLVATEAAKLALTGLSPGDLAIVNFNGTGRAVYRYNGAGENNPTNWVLVSPISVAVNGNETRNTATFSDGAGLVIDHVPVGWYRVDMQLTEFETSGGFKWRFNPGATIAANAKATISRAYIGVEWTSDIIAGASWSSLGNSTGLFSITGWINVTAAGTLPFQWAREGGSGTTTLIAATITLTPTR